MFEDVEVGSRVKVTTKFKDHEQVIIEGVYESDAGAGLVVIGGHYFGHGAVTAVEVLAPPPPPLWHNALAIVATYEGTRQCFVRSGVKSPFCWVDSTGYARDVRDLSDVRILVGSEDEL